MHPALRAPGWLSLLPVLLQIGDNRLRSQSIRYVLRPRRLRLVGLKVEHVVDYIALHFTDREVLELILQLLRAQSNLLLIMIARLELLGELEALDGLQRIALVLLLGLNSHAAGAFPLLVAISPGRPLQAP